MNNEETFFASCIYFGLKFRSVIFILHFCALHKPSVMISTVAVYHIQRTQKKLVLFDQEFKVVFEERQVFEEISDEEGVACEDLHRMTNWIFESWERLEADTRFDVKAVNFTTYGPALVHLNQNSEPIAPLLDYRKPFPTELETTFFKTYGGKDRMMLGTYSSFYGMGNAGIQLYWIKHHYPTLFKKIRTSLFLPQYCSFLFTTNFHTEYTSLGGHSLLWDFANKRFDQWVYEEGLVDLFPKISTQHEAGVTPFRHTFIPVGVGLLDAVSGLIPLIKRNIDAFLLLSTGATFTVLNPFSFKPLGVEDLRKDCFCYLSLEGNPVKAARLTLGTLHDQYTKKFASHFFRESDFYKWVKYDEELAANTHTLPSLLDDYYQPKPDFKSASLDDFETYEQAYHKLVSDMVRLQLQSIFLAGENLAGIKKMYVEGDFAENELFMRMLTDSLPQLKIKSSDLGEGPAMGAALAMKALVDFN